MAVKCCGVMTRCLTTDTQSVRENLMSRENHNKNGSEVSIRRLNAEHY